MGFAAVKAALRSLQNKIRALEKERLEAEKNIQLLTSDTYQQLSDFTDYEKQKQTSDALEPSTASISVIPDKSRCTISKGASGNVTWYSRSLGDYYDHTFFEAKLKIILYCIVFILIIPGPVLLVCSIIIADISG